MKRRTLVKGDDFLVLASDGLWDVMSSADAAVIVHRERKSLSLPRSLSPASSLSRLLAPCVSCAQGVSVCLSVCRLWASLFPPHCPARLSPPRSRSSSSSSSPSASSSSHAGQGERDHDECWTSQGQLSTLNPNG